ncbi:Mu-like prophage major head subunit gpT family protein [Nitratidesulfovibrio liaohensis]|uniref:Mu-like prophage major head subunit gpT family protein n=1 Tax=Nitratidesulfovibrio liaohensis TaxID=2604158 RepID=A0ABY9QY32_9BACT|nr:Mu-like prophage major head subunit gpT family protein [Nitratidesulfovibrio liaohensis]WMW64404.1 Mu-like prophage major head subunit gpT family protein [Nitratidesulfovibrio liaohensis]
MGEHGEYKTGALKDKQERYAVRKYGKILGLTLEMIVNDDLRAFAKLPTMFGAAASRKQSDIVYALLTSNPTMADGVALFHTSRGNIETAVANKTAPNVTNLSAARQALRLRKGLNGSRLNIRGKFVLVPVALSTSTEILLASATLTISGVSDQAKNPVGDLIPISDPRLDDVSSKEWYLLPDPAQVDTVEVAFLDGERMPVVTEHEEFRTDAMLFKARCVFGAGAMDDKMYKNPGV